MNGIKQSGRLTIFVAEPLGSPWCYISEVKWLIPLRSAKTADSAVKLTGKLDRDGGVVVGRGMAVRVEGGLNDLGRNGAFAANAPVVATKFDDR